MDQEISPPMKTRPPTKSSSTSLISTGPASGKVTKRTRSWHAKGLILALVAAASHLERCLPTSFYHLIDFFGSIVCCHNTHDISINNGVRECGDTRENSQEGDSVME